MAVFLIFWCAILAIVFFVISTIFKSIGSALIGIENAIVSTGAIAILAVLFYYLTFAIADLMRFAVFGGAGKFFEELLGIILIVVIIFVVIYYIGDLVYLIIAALDLLISGIAIICIKLGELFSRIYEFFVVKIMANMERC